MSFFKTTKQNFCSSPTLSPNTQPFSQDSSWEKEKKILKRQTIAGPNMSDELKDIIGKTTDMVKEKVQELIKASSDIFQEVNSCLAPAAENWKKMIENTQEILFASTSEPQLSWKNLRHLLIKLLKQPKVDCSCHVKQGEKINQLKMQFIMLLSELTRSLYFFEEQNKTDIDQLRSNRNLKQIYSFDLQALSKKSRGNLSRKQKPRPNAFKER